MPGSFRIYRFSNDYFRFGYGQNTSNYPFDGGVHHSNDYIYLFPYPASVANLNEADTEMAKKMVHLWTSFALNGRPDVLDAEDGFEWEPVTSKCLVSIPKYYSARILRSK